jgi:uncharacterized protein
VRRVFADSSFYIALLAANDDHHEDAVRIGSALVAEQVPLAVSHAVAFEVLAFFSRRGQDARARAAQLVERVLHSPSVEVVATTSGLLDAALDLYRRRLDKRYSLADCLAMVICRDRGISDVLTTDRDFEAEGFTILLDG